jgi:GTP-binding protein HflX
MEKALIVGVELNNSQYSIDYSLDELANLAKSLDIKVLGRVTQKLDTINPRYYIGSGKVEEIKNEATALDIDTIIFDDELSPSQIRNLEEALELTVIDRTLLILDIFAKRASKNEAMLEVRLAKLKYMLPRLVGLNKSLSRQGGSASVASKGSGEKQIELDRRKIAAEIIQIEEKLKKIKSDRAHQRVKREKTSIPIVSLVGYTNAGKSTTFNTILKYSKEKNDKEVMEKDMLFATLGTSVRNVKLPNNQQILLIDTVGFVSKLPTLLVNSFRSTLEEIINSSLIIHVVDISSPYYANQIDVTKNVLKEIGVGDIKELYLLNKADKANPPGFFIEGESIPFSNKSGLNHGKLIELIEDKVIDHSNTLIDLNVSLADGKAISIIEGYGIVKAKLYSQESIYYKAYIPNNLINEIRKYIIYK